MDSFSGYSCAGPWDSGARCRGHELKYTSSAVRASSAAFGWRQCKETRPRVSVARACDTAVSVLADYEAKIAALQRKDRLTDRGDRFSSKRRSCVSSDLSTISGAQVVPSLGSAK